MSQSKRFKICGPNVINETMDGESVIINLNTGFYYSLDQVGAEIWEAIQHQSTVGDIIANLMNRYSGQNGDVTDAVSELTDELVKEGLVVQVPEGEPNTTPMTPSSSPASQKSNFVKPKLQKFGDMKDLLLLDPIHEVDEEGWPHTKDDTPEKK